MNIEINIPDNLNEITLGQYQEFLKIEDPTEEDILKVFLNLDLKGIGKVKAADVDKYAAHITSLFEQEQRHSLKFNLKGVEYGFLPNLDDITYGENKDVTAYLNDWQSMHKAMAVLYRPITQKLSGKYLIENYEGSHKYGETMKSMPLGIVMGAMVFFYNLTNELLKAIPNYLEKEAMKEQMKGQISEQNGEAIKKYTHLLKETLGDLAKLQTYPYTLA
tara:strand:+ start:2075 stop:2731 length:657 start_codon:yes stop_codon:yes gene_type:complete